MPRPAQIQLQSRVFIALLFFSLVLTVFPARRRRLYLPSHSRAPVVTLQRAEIHPRLEVLEGLLTCEEDMYRGLLLRTRTSVEGFKSEHVVKTVFCRRYRYKNAKPEIKESRWRMSSKIKTTIAIAPCVFCTSPYPITHVHEAVQSRRILRTTMPNAIA